MTKTFYYLSLPSFIELLLSWVTMLITVFNRNSWTSITEWPPPHNGFFSTMTTTSLFEATDEKVRNDHEIWSICRLQNSRFFFSKSVKKSVKRGVRVLRARSARASHARRACEAREKKTSLALCFQPHSRPFVWLLARTWIRKNTDCFAV